MINIDGVPQDPIPLLDLTSSWARNVSVALPVSAIGEIKTIGFQVISGMDGIFQSIVDIDNVEFIHLPDVPEPVDLGAVVDAFNSGVQDVRQFGQISGLIGEAFGADLPLFEESVADLASAANKFVEPFLNDLGQVNDLTELNDALAALNLAI